MDLILKSWRSEESEPTMRPTLNSTFIQIMELAAESRDCLYMSDDRIKS